MKDQIVSKSYAQAIIQLGTETNVDVAKELTTLQEVINKSDDLENVMFLDVFTVEEKLTVINDILEKLSLSQIVKNFIVFLTHEQRLGMLPLIYKEVIVIDDDKKGFLRGTIQGAKDEPSEKVVEKIKAYLEEKLGKKTVLTYEKSENISAGYKVTVGDLQLDASLDNQLRQFKDSVLN